MKVFINILIRLFFVYSFFPVFCSENQELSPLQKQLQDSVSRGMVVFFSAAIISGIEQAARLYEEENNQNHFLSNTLKTYKMFLLIKATSIGIASPLYHYFFKKNN